MPTPNRGDLYTATGNPQEMPKLPPCVERLLASDDILTDDTLIAHAKYFLKNSVTLVWGIIDARTKAGKPSLGDLGALGLFDKLMNIRPNMDCPYVSRKLGADICAACPMRVSTDAVRKLMSVIRRVYKDEEKYYVVVCVEGMERTVPIPIARIAKTLEISSKLNTKKGETPARWANTLYLVAFNDFPVLPITHIEAADLAFFIHTNAQLAPDEGSAELREHFLAFLHTMADVAVPLEYAAKVDFPEPPDLIVSRGAAFFRLDAFRNYLRRVGIPFPRSIISGLGPLISRSVRLEAAGRRPRYYVVSYSELKALDQELVQKLQEAHERAMKEYEMRSVVEELKHKRLEKILSKLEESSSREEVETHEL